MNSLGTNTRSLTYAAYAILIAGIFDMMDGRVARMTDSSSDFGVEYDSLADICSFVIAPAILAYAAALRHFGRLGWMACFLFVACGALRLARFNVKANAGTNEKRYFQGLPAPLAAYMLTTTILIHIGFHLNRYIGAVYIMVIAFMLGFLMVSNIKYRSFKDLNLANRRSFQTLISAVILLMIVMTHPIIMIFVVVTLYVGSGMISLLLQNHKLFQKITKSNCYLHLL